MNAIALALGSLRLTRNCALGRDDGWILLRALATRCARVFLNSFAPKKKRAQGRPGARCTRGLMCKNAQSKDAHEHTGSAESLRPSLRNGFNGLFRALPGDEFVLSPSLADKACLSPVGPTRLRQFSTSNGCQDHTALPYASAPLVLRVLIAHGQTALRSISRDDAAASTASRAQRS